MFGFKKPVKETAADGDFRIIRKVATETGEPYFVARFFLKGKWWEKVTVTLFYTSPSTKKLMWKATPYETYSFGGQEHLCPFEFPSIEAAEKELCVAYNDCREKEEQKDMKLRLRSERIAYNKTESVIRSGHCTCAEYRPNNS